MRDQLVTYEQALEAKTKGFDYPCFAYFAPLKDWMKGKAWDKLGNGMYLKMPTNPFGDYDNSKSALSNSYFTKAIEHVAAPTQSLLQAWLRNVHNLHIDPTHLVDEDGIWYTHYYSLGIFKSYEECLENGLTVALSKIPTI